ncbi:hypothetical protein T03_9256 [Trichinella britovi]|uniref:Uncharacterized protein n=1 Tax=Trichinella britovi TaxID=45882 RepID=A0A0V1C8K8_TRIBR|nr:hypothetical protein T03_9256 [Trichinella britovi]
MQTHILVCLIDLYCTNKQTNVNKNEQNENRAVYSNLVIFETISRNEIVEVEQCTVLSIRIATSEGLGYLRRFPMDDSIDSDHNIPPPNSPFVWIQFKYTNQSRCQDEFLLLFKVLKRHLQLFVEKQNYCYPDQNF